MIIKNPTKNDIEVTVFGTQYKILAEDSLNDVPERDARYWQENLHNFLILRKEKEAAVEPVLPQTSAMTVEAVVEEVPEEETEETQEVEEKPVKKTAAKKK